MQITSFQMILAIVLIALGTMITRFLPFVLFPENKEPNKFISFLGKMLPPAMMGLLVVYCLKDLSFSAPPYGIPEILAVLVTAVLHLCFKKVLISIGVSTVFYMILVQTDCINTLLMAL